MRDSNTQITVTLSEPCLNTTNAYDGGFTVTQNGSTKTFEVLSTAEGSVVLTVQDMTAAASYGVVVTYTAGGNGQITDASGNPLASSDTGIVIDAWDSLNPQTGDHSHLALWFILLFASGTLILFSLHRLGCIRKHG